MTVRWPNLVGYVCLAVGVLIGTQLADTYKRDDPPARTVVSDDAYNRRTAAINRNADALEAVANQPRVTAEQSELVDDARDLLDDIRDEEGDVTVQTTTDPVPAGGEGDQGEPAPTTVPATTTTTVPLLGSITNPLQGHATPTTTGP